MCLAHCDHFSRTRSRYMVVLQRNNPSLIFFVFFLWSGVWVARSQVKGVGFFFSGSTRKRIFPPLPKIQLCVGPYWGPTLLSRCEKCKSQQPSSRTAFVITVTTQPGMLLHVSAKCNFLCWLLLALILASTVFFG